MEESFQLEKVSLELSPSSWFVECGEMNRKETLREHGKTLGMFNPENGRFQQGPQSG